MPVVETVVGQHSPIPVLHHQQQQQQQQQQHHQHQKKLYNNNNNNNIVCGSCCQPICDRYLLRVGDISYHESCLQCCACDAHLLNSCFHRNGKIYCRIDYERLFVKNHCFSCGEKISSDEFVMRASVENIFHLKCFVCVVCGVRLQKGDQYVIKQSQLFCRPDYEKEVEMMQGYGNYDDFCCDEIYPTRIDGRRGPKRPRTILTTQQRRAFKASFDITPKPCRKIREGLAKDTGLSIRIVQVWFQNQRAKVKKIQKKAHKEGGNKRNRPNHDNDSMNEDSSETDSKSSMKIKEEDPRSNTYLSHHDSGTSDNECGSGTSNNSNGGAVSGFNNFQSNHLARFGIHDTTNNNLGVGGALVKEENLENDEEFFRIMSNGNNQLQGQGGRGGRMGFIDKSSEQFQHLLPLDFQSMTQNHLQQGTNFHQQISGSNHTPLNPIDRLYSMQNSYFCNNQLESPAPMSD
uniref:CSON002957 protein n=1 Tax=Culicoides sonorensis TaxID=179676 RepID=A0A336MYA1_CULSO